MSKRLLLIIVLVFAVTVLGIQPVLGKTSSLHSVSGRFLFGGQPPPVGAFKVGLCEVIDEGMLCGYDIVPPAPKDTIGEDGYFEIVDVEPGKYGIVWEFNHLIQIMPHWSDSPYEIVFEIVDSDIQIALQDYDCKWPCGIPGIIAYRLYFPSILTQQRSRNIPYRPTGDESPFQNDVSKVKIFQVGEND